MTSKPSITFILDRNDAGQLMLFACRGAGKGCRRNLNRRKAKHCDDCLPANDPKETIEHFKARLERGDA